MEVWNVHAPEEFAHHDFLMEVVHLRSGYLSTSDEQHGAGFHLEPEGCMDTDDGCKARFLCGTAT